MTADATDSVQTNETGRAATRVGHMNAAGRRWGLVVLTPLLAVFIVMNMLPLIDLVKMSLQNQALVASGRSAPLTFANYARVFRDPEFWEVLRNTLVFTLLRVPLALVIGLIVALGIRRLTKFRSVFVLAWFSPFVTSLVAMAVVFSYMYNPNFGLINDFLRWAGLPPQGFLADPNQALLSIVFVDLWKNVGFNVLVFLGGLLAIPIELSEAARVDGARSWKLFRYITLPLLSRTTYMLLVIGVITSMRVFVPVYVMSGFSLSSGTLGGPLNSTNVLTLDMYQRAFRFGDLGYACAVAVVLFVIVMLVTIVQFRLLQVRWKI